MSLKGYKLTNYEKSVEDLINGLFEPYRGRYSIHAGEASYGGWEAEIVPTNSKAAKIHIHDIDSNTIYLTVDDTYNMEFFVNEEEYKQGLPDFKAHLAAILLGKVKGYHVRDKRDYLKYTYLKTVIEFEIENTIIPWCRNVIFRSWFIKRKDVVEQTFESY